MGRFAQAVGLSRKALRLYDQLEILVPDHVDPQSGYRYYSPVQFEQARFIRMLRAMDMPLAGIRQVLEAATADETVRLVLDCQKAFEAKADQVHQASQKVLAYLRKENDTVLIEVTIQEFMTRQVVSIKKNITIPAFHQFIPEALAQLKTQVEAGGGVISGNPICFYYGPVNESDDGPVEICMPFEGKVNPGEKFQIHEVPAHKGAIRRTASGQISFPEIMEAWDAVISWVNKSGLVMSEDPVCCYEIWHGDDSISIVQPVEGEVPT